MIGLHEVLTADQGQPWLTVNIMKFVVTQFILGYNIVTFAVQCYGGREHYSFAK